MEIYIVFGSKGEYSDRNEWIIVAYTDKAKAKQHVYNATKKSQEIATLQEEIYKPFCKNNTPLTDEAITESRRLTKSNSYDPGVDHDWLDSFSYYYEKTDLIS